MAFAAGVGAPAALSFGEGLAASVAGAGFGVVDGSVVFVDEEVGGFAEPVGFFPDPYQGLVGTDGAGLEEASGPCVAWVAVGVGGFGFSVESVVLEVVAVGLDGDDTVDVFFGVAGPDAATCRRGLVAVEPPLPSHPRGRVGFVGGDEASGSAVEACFDCDGVGDGEEPEGAHLSGVGAVVVVGGEAGEFVERRDGESPDGGLVEPVGLGMVETEFDVEEVVPPHVEPVLAAGFGEG